MSDANFDRAFLRTVGYEGGYQNQYNDKGNWTSGIVGKGTRKGTKYGIAASSYPDLDIQSLTEEQAKEIYYKDFWLKMNCDKFDFKISYNLFDAGVNHGIKNAIKFLQRAVGAVDDGILGPKTITTTRAQDPMNVAIRFLSERLKFYTTLSTFKIYGAGWSKRVALNLDYLGQVE